MSNLADMSLGKDERRARQRAAALARANAVRSARASIRRELKAGELGFAEALAKAPGSTPVAELLEALPGNGAVRTRSEAPAVSKSRVLAREVMEGAELDPEVTVGELSDDERETLLRALPDRHRPRGLAPIAPDDQRHVIEVPGIREGLAGREVPVEALRSLIGALRFYAEGGEGCERAREALAGLTERGAGG